MLLIRGGVYADIDVLIETNLDDAIADDVGFMTPIDEPEFLRYVWRLPSYIQHHNRCRLFGFFLRSILP